MAYGNLCVIRPIPLSLEKQADAGVILIVADMLNIRYLTIDKNLTVEVSHRIKEDFGNGQEYYAYHGSRLIVLPQTGEQLPNQQYLEWHNENVYRALA